jgi:hypothetical protein
LEDNHQEDVWQYSSSIAQLPLHKQQLELAWELRGVVDLDCHHHNTDWPRSNVLVGGVDVTAGVWDVSGLDDVGATSSKRFISVHAVSSCRTSPS